MSDTPTAPADALATMAAELHEMELAHVELAGRIVQQRRNMALVEQVVPRRPGRPPTKPALVTSGGDTGEVA